jgi:tRNA(fMet)-specific endonuclease VapC
LWSGVECSQSRELNLRRLQHGLSRLINWPYDENAAVEFGRIFAKLKQAGRPMQQIDIQIAAIAISLGNCVVITTDSDLLAVPGLKTDDWSVTAR